MLERGLDTSACIVPPDTPPCVSPVGGNDGNDVDDDAAEERPPSVASVSSLTAPVSLGLR
jgi:hypothetical protein